MEKELEILVLSALLHDIGKFAQRAKRPYSKNMEGEYLTNNHGKPGHWHTLYTDYFLEKDLCLPAELEKDRSRIARVSSAHHRPNENSLHEMAVMVADCLSAGIDRIKEDNESEAGFRESRLISVFEEIELINHTFSPPGSSYYKLEPLEIGTKSIFPMKGTPEGPPEEYVGLFNRFYSEQEKLITNSGFVFYLEGLISTLEKFTWCIPSSSYKTLSDIPLFDHSLSTAGIAQALYLYHQQEGTLPKENDKESKFILMGGDLSGIQDYIFGINRSSGRGVAKIFRARSFFLQALMRSVIIEIQNRTGVTSVCRLVDSGGKFILLLPLTSKNNKILDTLDSELQDWFRRRFKGLLTLNISYGIHLQQKHFLLNEFQTKIEEINGALQTNKLRKLRRTFKIDGPIIKGDYDEMEGGNCTLCSINAADKTATEKYLEKEGVETPVCKECCDQIVYTGTLLPNTNYLIYTNNAKIAPRIELFGATGLILSEEEPQQLENMHLIESLVDSGKFSRVRIARHIPRITKEELKDSRWYNLLAEEGDDKYPEEGQPKTFSMIANKSKKESKDGDLIGRPLLGFFKADVDNLGLIFSLGLKDKMSVARLASSSRMLNIFFSEYIVELAQKEFPDIYVVFAGGDDLFTIGPWNKIINFAIELRKKLALFCAGNPDITLSGGILIAKPRLPMRKAVALAEDHLGLAKQYTSPNRIKNNVCLLGEVLSWEEAEELIKIGEKIDKAIEEKERTNFSTAFIYRLLEYHNMYRKFSHEKKIKFGRYLSLAHYDIARNIQSRKNNNQEELEMLFDIFTIGASERKTLEMLNIPLFYAINSNRTSN
jgi:CRISPR-associated protein Csm1